MRAAGGATKAKDAVQRLKNGPGRRDQLQRDVRDYLNLPVVLAAVLILLLAWPWITQHPGSAWHGGPLTVLFVIWALLLIEFAVKFTLAPEKLSYLRHHWWELLIALLPVFGIVRLVVALRDLVRENSSGAPHFAILRKRHLDKLALISVIVTFIGATLALLFEQGAHGTTITSFGAALYWAAALITTVASQLYPVTPGGQAVSLALMIYSVAFFAYLASSLASALIGGDAQQQANAEAKSAANRSAHAGSSGNGLTAAITGNAQPADDGTLLVRLSASDVAALRSLLSHIDTSGAHPSGDRAG